MNDTEISHREIGERLGISRARVQQLEKQAYAKIRVLILTGDFPLLREAFGIEAVKGVEADIATDDALRVRERANENARRRARSQRRKVTSEAKENGDGC